MTLEGYTGSSRPYKLIDIFLYYHTGIRRGITEEDPLSSIHLAWHQRSDGEERAGRIFESQFDR